MKRKTPAWKKIPPWMIDELNRSRRPPVEQWAPSPLPPEMPREDDKEPVVYENTLSMI
jgi:hypothetical protein